MNKKIKEHKVVEYFIKLRNLNWKILSLKEAQKQFSNYKEEESPDCIILNNDNHTYIGIEVFRMDLDKSKRLSPNKAKNLSERNAYLEKRSKEEWYINEDITDILDARLSDKLSKLTNYIGDIPIWFIGYADQPFNFDVLARNIERGTIGDIKDNFYKKLDAKKLNRFIQVWIVDNGGNTELMYENKIIDHS